MNSALDDSRYAYIHSWWNPHFLKSEVDKNFRLQFDLSALSNVRIILLILIFFWCGFVWFDRFLSPDSKSQVLLFRFAIVLPIFILLGAFSFTRPAKSFYQYIIVLAESVAYVALIRVVVLYDDLGLFVNQLGFELSMPSQDAKFIFVTIWIIVVFAASLAARIRTLPVLILSAVLIMAMLATIKTAESISTGRVLSLPGS